MIMLLQSDIDSTHDWWTANLMTLNISKTRAITTSRNTITLFCKYKLRDSYITRTDFVKDLGILIDFKLYVDCHVYYAFSQSIKLLRLSRRITFSFFDLDSLIILYFSIVIPTLEYASVVWISVTCSDAKNLSTFRGRS
jgi:hypothetical protein